LVKRSRFARVPSIPVGWVKSTVPNPRNLPFPLLDPSELRFLKVISGRELFSREELVDLLHDCFGELVSSLGDDSFGGNLFVGECYADREYFTRDGVSRGFIRVFRLGLVCAVPMPAEGTRFKYWYCYWREKPYRLLSSNFVRPLPPHNPFSSWCFRALRDGLSEDEMSLASLSTRRIPLWDGSGDYVADNCYRVTSNGKQNYLWVEIHTGSEGYDERYFIPRLLSAERHLKGKGRYVVIVPFKRDLALAKRSIRKYNLVATENETKPSLDLQLSEIISYQQIDSFREKLGFYKHATFV